MEAQQGMDVVRLADHGLFTVTLSAIDRMLPVITNTIPPLFLLHYVASIIVVIPRMLTPCICL
jgi:hypothetical protein